MAKDKITDLRHHLFAQLERLGDDDLMADTEKRHQEIHRAKAVTEVAQAIVNAAKLEIDYIKALHNAPLNMAIKPKFLGLEDGETKSKT